MSDPAWERIVTAIHAELGYLHKERWAEHAAQLRDVARHTQGEAQEQALQALRDHYADRFQAETTRDALLAQAARNEWMLQSSVPPFAPSGALGTATSYQGLYMRWRSSSSGTRMTRSPSGRASWRCKYSARCRTAPGWASP